MPMIATEGTTDVRREGLFEPFAALPVRGIDYGKNIILSTFVDYSDQAVGVSLLVGNHPIKLAYFQ